MKKTTVSVVYEFNGALYADKDTAVARARDAIHSLIGASGFEEDYLKRSDHRDGGVYLSYESANGALLSCRVYEREVH